MKQIYGEIIWLRVSQTNILTKFISRLEKKEEVILSNKVMNFI